jgi:hypothetical protein
MIRKEDVVTYLWALLQHLLVGSDYSYDCLNTGKLWNLTVRSGVLLTRLCSVLVLSRLYFCLHQLTLSLSTRPLKNKNNADCPNSF